MIRRAALSLTALLLVACSGNPDPPGNAEGADIAPTSNQRPSDDAKVLPIGAIPPVDLQGEWRVAGVNGVAWDASVGWAMTARISDDSISLASQCVGFGRSYALDGMKLSHLPPAGRAEGPVPLPPPQCLRTMLDQEKAASRALQGARWAYRLPDGSLVLDGPDGTITLFTQ